MPPADTPDSREASAADWAVALDAGPLDTSRRAALDAWLAIDSRHYGALVRAQAVLHLATDAPAEPASRSTPQWTRRAALAGFAVVGAGVIAGLALKPDAALATGVGEIRRVPLADGSSVVLDTDTSLRPEFAEGTRQVAMRHGRSLFRVTRGSSAPLTVVAGAVSIRALDATFSLTMLEDVVVLVLSGTVDVLGEYDFIRLQAGQQARYTGEKPTITSLTPERLEQAVLWRDGRLEFDGETLADAARQMSRYSRRPIEITTERLAAMPIYGGFRTDDPEGFARTAALALGGSSSATDQRISISA